MPGSDPRWRPGCRPASDHSAQPSLDLSAALSISIRCDPRLARADHIYDCSARCTPAARSSPPGIDVLTHIVPDDTICVMLSTSTRTAEAMGVSRQQAARAMRSGLVVTGEVAGRKVASGRSITAAKRMSARGRRWSDRTRIAAQELLHDGTTEVLEGSALSRLRANLRRMSAGELAYRALPGHVGLFRSTAQRVELDAELASELGLAAAGGVAVWKTADVDRETRRRRLLSDVEGDVVVIEDDGAKGCVAEVLGLFAFGGARESGAAEAWLAARIARL